MQTVESGTLSGNRFSITTTIFHAIISGKKLLNKTYVDRKSTDLILNYNKTKSTQDTHKKKVEKLHKKYPTTILTNGEAL